MNFDAHSFASLTPFGRAEIVLRATGGAGSPSAVSFIAGSRIRAASGGVSGRRIGGTA